MTPRPRPPMFTAALFAAGAAAFAQDAATLQVRSLAASCAQCHGTDGRTPPGSAMRSLAGMPAPYLAEQLLAFRSGERPGIVMPQLAKGYGDAQIARLAGYFAGVPAVAPRP
ncbi:MAG: c-type cytochrome [Pseudomonadota bacterium]